MNAPCIVCKAYLEHYPVMVGDWDCEHEGKETVFMLALADAIHVEPVGEFTDPGWRAAQFLDDAELAFSCGDAPYSINIRPGYVSDGWVMLALVNGRYLIGTRDEENAESEFIADLNGWLPIPEGSEK